MKREKIEANRERQYLSALATSKPFLVKVVDLADPEMFPAKAAGHIARLCLKYFGNYHEPPGLKTLGHECRAWAVAENIPEAEAETVIDLVEELSDEANTNAAYLAAEFGRYMTGRKLGLLLGTAQSFQENGNQDEAIRALAGFREIAKEEGNTFNILTDVAEVFASPAQSIIDWPGAAGWFFEAATTREALIGIQGPEKMGKTTWCEEVMFRAVASRRNVAFFEVGDLSRIELRRRLLSRMAQLPLWPRQAEEGVLIPQAIKVTRGTDGKLVPEVEHTLRKFPHELNEAAARIAQARFARTHKIDAERPTVNFSIHANSSINVRGIDNMLRRWRDVDGWIADCVIIDYPDILAPENDRKEYRDQIDETWRALKRLSQEWNACVVCPTQAKATAYKARTQKMEHFSGNKLKNAHVNGMLGLNQTEKEKELGVMRLNWINLRGSDSHANQFLWVATCYPLGVALAKCCRG